MIAAAINWARSGFSSFFSSRIEDSFRLRTLALAGLWIAAMGLYCIGGELTYCLAGAVLGTGGHWFSYKMRNQPSRLRPILIGVAVITLSVGTAKRLESGKKKGGLLAAFLFALGVQRCRP